MDWILQRNIVSSNCRLNNLDFDGLRKRSMSASMFEHLIMLSHTDLRSPAILASSKYTTL